MEIGLIVYIHGARIVTDHIGLLKFALLELVIRNLRLDFLKASQGKEAKPRTQHWTLPAEPIVLGESLSSQGPPSVLSFVDLSGSDRPYHLWGWAFRQPDTRPVSSRGLGKHWLYKFNHRSLKPSCHIWFLYTSFSKMTFSSKPW